MQVRAGPARGGAYDGGAYGGQPRTLKTSLDPNSLDNAEPTTAIATLREGIDEAYELGAVGVAFLAGRYPGKDKEEAACQALEDSVRQLCAHAKARGGMPVVLEIFDRDVEKKSLVGPNNIALRIVQDVRKECDNFGLLVDLSHLPLLGQTPEDALMPVKDCLMQVHIGNVVVGDRSHPAYGDAHPRFGIRGGANDADELAHFLKVFLDVGYLGEGVQPRIVSFEVQPLPGEKPEVVIANAKRTLNEAWAKLY